jgi:Uma2 family endonuclease
MNGVQPVRIPYTYREYACLPEDGQIHELIEGDFFVSPAPGSVHQTVSRRLQYALMRALEETRLAWVFNAPTDVILGPHTVVQPDLAIVRTSRRDAISKRGIEGAPDVVVEIVSPTSGERDEYMKRFAYARHGVPEYWLVTPEVGSVEIFRLDDQGLTPFRRFDRSSLLTTPSFAEVSIPLAPIFAPL